MDDINFDELDKAVNSVMQPTDVETAPAESTQTVATSVSPIVQTKRRGQFMDMVHPSSDMSKPSPVSSTPPIRRQTSIVQPLDPSIVETSQAPTVVTEEVPAAEYVPQASVATETKAEPSIAWPDPINTPVSSNVSDISPEVETTITTVEGEFVQTEPAVAEQAQTIEPQLAEPAQSDPIGIPESPFVEGAAVEKRPLGAFTPLYEEQLGGVALEEMPATEPEEASSEGGILETAAADVESTEPMPIDTTANTYTDVVQSSDNESVLSAQKSETVSGAATGQPVVTQSIPQQYRPEEIAHDDTEEHAVFDTADYHQPLPMPEKTRGAGHKTVLYILFGVLMVAIGAGAGYAVFVLQLF